MKNTERLEAQKNKILKNSIELFFQKGYQKTTTREIAQAAEINKGLLHYYYKKKEEIIFDIYNDFVKYLIEFLEYECKHELKGYSSFALLNMLFFKVITSRDIFINNLLDILATPEMAKFKIEKSIENCRKILDYSKKTKEDDQLLLAITVTIGSEAQLLYAIKKGAIIITYEELAVTIERLFLTMLRVDPNDIDIIIREALIKCNEIDVDSVLNYFSKNCTWLQD